MAHTNSRDETSPLLSDDESTLDDRRATKTKVTPLPKVQLGGESCPSILGGGWHSSLNFSVLCAVRMAEPIAFSQIFPYINEFMNDLHLTDDPKRIGFYSGLVVCIRVLSVHLGNHF